MSSQHRSVSHPGHSSSTAGWSLVDTMRTQLGPAKDYDMKRMRRVERLAWMLDHSVRVPGTELRFGLDSVVGLIPGVGDLAMSAAGLYIVYEARRMGVSKRTLAKMGTNVLIDLTVGSVPILGDALDLFYKSNLRNVRLLQKSVTPQAQRRRLRTANRGHRVGHGTQT